MLRQNPEPELDGLVLVIWFNFSEPKVGLAVRESDTSWMLLHTKRSISQTSLTLSLSGVATPFVEGVGMCVCVCASPNICLFTPMIQTHTHIVTTPISFRKCAPPRMGHQVTLKSYTIHE